MTLPEKPPKAEIHPALESIYRKEKNYIREITLFEKSICNMTRPQRDKWKRINQTTKMFFIRLLELGDIKMAARAVGKNVSTVRKYIAKNQLIMSWIENMQTIAATKGAFESAAAHRTSILCQLEDMRGADMADMMTLAQAIENGLGDNVKKTKSFMMTDKETGEERLIQVVEEWRDKLPVIKLINEMQGYSAPKLTQQLGADGRPVDPTENNKVEFTVNVVHHDPEAIRRRVEGEDAKQAIAGSEGMELDVKNEWSDKK